MHCMYSLNEHPCFADSRLGQSWTWKRILAVQVMAERHISWLLYNGKSFFWHDNWLGSRPLCQQVKDTIEKHVVIDFVKQGH